MQWRRGVFASICLLASGTGVASAADLDKAPPAFAYLDRMAVPVDIETVHVDYGFDVATSVAHAKATVTFRSGQAGYPVFDLVPAATALRVNGQEVAPTELQTVVDPTRVTKVRVLHWPVAANTEYQVEIEYNLSTSDVTFSSGKVRVGFFMDDLGAGGRGFFEKYGPSNFEFDQIKFSFDVHLEGTAIEHEVFTNGDLVATGANSWHVDFPDYFTTSSPYFHLAERGRFIAQHYTFNGMSADIPVTIYSQSTSTTATGVTDTKRYLVELENTYGAFAHAGVVVYLTPSGGGMEHCGAAMTSLSALGHELTHSWFARGVMPQDGNSGWIDEAIASWRDAGYPRAPMGPNRSPVNLGGFSVYRRHTSTDAYTLGQQLISEFDGMFSGQGGMRAILRELFAEAKRTTISNAFLQHFLEAHTGQNLTGVFNRYVFGRASAGDRFKVVGARDLGLSAIAKSRHPRRYTPAELELYR